jgi:hypothetical protein
LDDLEGLREEMEGSFRAYPFMDGLFPFASQVRAAIPGVAGVRALGTAEHDAGRFPQLHRKTQWLLDREVVRAVAAAAGEGTLSEDRLMDLHDKLAQRNGWPEDDPVLYFALGSLNKNIRSMALDGEVLALVAGPWALHSLFDLVLLASGVTWVDSLSAVEELLPPLTPFKRRLGRWLHRVL